MAFASTAEIEKQIILAGAEHEEDAESQEAEIREDVSCSDERSESQYSYAGGAPESESQSDGGGSAGFFEGVFG